MKLSDTAKSIYFEEAKKIAKERDGECLSSEYISIHTKMTWKHNVCGTIWEANLHSIKHGKWCPNKVCAQNKKKQTNLERHGIENPLQNKGVHQKTIQTNLEKYGCKYPFQNKNIQKKVKQTNIDKFGSANPLQNKEIKEKAEQTNLERYGTTSPIQNKDVKNKRVKTNLERWGCKTHLQNKDIKNQIKQTNIERYGSANPLQNKDILEKIRQTNLEKWGVEHHFESKEIQQKIRQTNIERYGCENPTQNKDIQEKIRKTNLERFGTENIFQNKDIQEKAKQTNLERYGVEHVTQNKDILEKIKETNLEKYGFEYSSQNQNIKNKVKETNLERYGVERPIQNKDIQEKAKQTRQNNGTNWTNESLKQFFLSHPEYYIDDVILPESCKDKTKFHDIEHGWFESILSNVKGQAILHPKRHKLIGGDIISSDLLYGMPYYNAQILNSNSRYRPDYLDEQNKLIIEADGLFWHIEARENNNFKVAHGTHKMNHFNKFEEYHKLGYKFLSFTEQEINEKPEIVKSLIAHKLGKTDNKTSARKCNLVRLKARQSKDFFTSNHLMGSGSGQTYALEFNGEIVCALRFVNKEHEIHISRFACKNQWNVVGGYSRLLKQLDKFNKTIVNFVDRRHGTGEHLANLGFTLESCRPGFWWTDGYNVYNRRKYLGNSGYDHGLEKYWDYGQAKWVKFKIN